MLDCSDVFDTTALENAIEEAVDEALDQPSFNDTITDACADALDDLIDNMPGQLRDAIDTRITKMLKQKGLLPSGRKT